LIKEKNMRLRRRHRLATLMALSLLCSTGVRADETGAVDEMRPLRVFAAGSLRAGIDDVIARFTAHTGVRVVPTYGASGKLRQEFEAGRGADVFASASIEHTDALAAQKILKASTVFARNAMCLLASPGVDIKGDLLAKMLDPATRLGTSTPKVDPAGDYAWKVFERAERLRPGAYALLDRKALKLLGNPALAPADVRPLPDLLKSGAADVFLMYCSYGEAVARQVAGVTWRTLPAGLDVEAAYGIGATADPRADQFVQFVLGAEGQQILAGHGFAPR
jgi:molybdate transport system substrate-binding protein